MRLKIAYEHRKKKTVSLFKQDKIFKIPAEKISVEEVLNSSMSKNADT